MRIADLKKSQYWRRARYRIWFALAVMMESQPRISGLVIAWMEKVGNLRPYDSGEVLC